MASVCNAAVTGPVFTTPKEFAIIQWHYANPETFGQDPSIACVWCSDGG